MRRPALLTLVLMGALLFLLLGASHAASANEEFELEETEDAEITPAVVPAAAVPAAAAAAAPQTYADAVRFGVATKDGQANVGDYVSPIQLTPADESTIRKLRAQWDALLNGQVQVTVNSRAELDAAAQLNAAQAREHHNSMAVQHGSGGIKWKDLVLTIRKHETAVTDAYKAFQTALANAMSAICNRAPVTCRALGKTDLTSDFDVMIEGPNMQANLYAELTIEWMLTKTFLSDSFFWSNPAKASFDLKRVLEFFDINFYLDNFGLMRTPNAGADRLASYYLSTDFRGQLPYAFMEDKPFAEKTLDIFHRKAAALVPLQNQVLAAGAKVTQPQINALINAKSDLSLYQDECYHTQGTLFHVVFMMQAKKEFVDSADHLNTLFDFFRLSIIENLLMAKAHEGKQKYMLRAVDARNRIEKAMIALPEAKAFLAVLDARITPALRAAFLTESAKPDVYQPFEKQQIPALIAELRALLRV